MTGGELAGTLARRALLVRLAALLREGVAFGGVGALAFVVDAGGFNLLRATVLPTEVITAKTISVSAAVVVAWVGNRYLTYRGRPKDRPLRELALFVATNLAGLAIAALCLAVSHYLLGLRTPLADNLSGNVVGTALGTLARFLSYRLLVFRLPKGQPA